MLINQVHEVDICGQIGTNVDIQKKILLKNKQTPKTH